jgi:hypothetical protein
VGNSTSIENDRRGTETVGEPIINGGTKRGQGLIRLKEYG